MDSILEKFKEFVLTLTDEELEYLGLARINPTEKTSKNLDKLITNTLEKLGIPPHNRGTLYLQTAIRIAYDNPDYLKQLTNNLYPETAKIHNTTSVIVYNHIIKAITFGHVHGNPNVWEHIFTSSIRSQKLGTLTNGYFLKGIVNYLIKQMQ